MYFFDKVFLGQFLDQKMPVKVFANEEWYQITGQSDLEDDITGIGYDVYGGDHRFDYRDIQQIKVGSKNVIDLKMLQDLKAGQKPEPEKGGEAKGGGDEEAEPEGEEPEEEPASDEKPEKEPDLSWYSPAYDIGRKIIHEAKRRKV